MGVEAEVLHLNGYDLVRPRLMHMSMAGGFWEPVLLVQSQESV